MPLKPLSYERDVTLGCDPEFFFTGSNGKTTGAEKILPEAGLTYKPGTYNHDGAHTALNDAPSKIVIDGVQAELNPRPNPCRANLANEISACFRDLHKTLKDRGINVSFSPVVDITQAELDSLSEKSKTFGCAPSTNVYAQSTSKISVDPKKYLKRSAGGHIHLGWGGSDRNKEALKNIEVMIPILDIIVGNTSVLIDRNPVNKERRKVYGKVGEYRLKEYGLEYRTLSNFWLQSYQIMSLMFGLSRLAVHVVAQSTTENNYAKAIIDAVPREDVIKAIQNNDFALAYSNFLKIEPLLCEMTARNTHDYPFNKDNIDAFHWFIKKGINYWFKEEPLHHWITLPEGHNTGWETFRDNKVKADMKDMKSKAASAVEDFEKKLEEIRKQAMGSLKELRARMKTLRQLEPKIEASESSKATKKLVEVLETVAPTKLK